MLLTKDEREALGGGLFHLSSHPVTKGIIQRAIDEYDAANPPAPKVICPACQSEMNFSGPTGSWLCSKMSCELDGPCDDPGGAKVMSLGQKPLPIEPPFVVVGNNAYQLLGIRGVGSNDRALSDMLKVIEPGSDDLLDLCRPIIGPPVDISAWLAKKENP